MSAIAAALAAIVEALPDGLVVVDADGAIQLVNRQAESLFGYSRHEMLGQPIAMLVPEHVLGLHAAYRLRYMGAPQSRPMGAGLTLSARRKDGSTRAVDISLSSINTGEAQLVSAVIRDISERLAIEEKFALEAGVHETELRDARDTAELASVAKTNFMSRMNHELRTPLNAVLGFAELLQLGELVGDGVREGVAAIEKGGNHLLTIINDILDVSRVETGKLSLSLEPVVIARRVADVLGLLAPIAASRHIALGTDISMSDASRLVLADRRSVEQILFNLVANAIKYNREGGRVLVSVTRHGEDQVRIAVSDTGYGIEPDQLSKVFVPFERLGVGHTVEGTGLGLTISKQLTEAMGSVLEVSSTVGSGSSFAFVLREATGPLSPTETEIGTDAATSGIQGVAPPQRVLYVAESAADIEVIEGIFEGHRPQISLISTLLGESAYSLARDHQPQLILLDIGLPDVAGLTLLSGLRLDAATRNIPVLMISAETDAAKIDRVLVAGAYGYLTKPIAISGLLEVVDRAVAVCQDQDVKLVGHPPGREAFVG